MSALGSSVINKSSKKFGPKQAPVRRAPTSAQTSARPSVDRRVQSQTPQPQPSQVRFAASPTPSISLSGATPVLPQSSVVNPLVIVHNKDSVAANAAISSVVQIPKPGSHREFLRGQSTERNAPAVVLPAPSTTVRVAAPAIREPFVGDPSRSESTRTPSQVPQRIDEVDQISATVGVQPSTDPQLLRTAPDPSEHRAAKRRRIDTTAQNSPLRTAEATTDTVDLLPSTEVDDLTDAVILGPAAPSQIFSQPIRQSIEPAPSAKTKRSRVTKQGHSRQQAVEAAALEVINDVTRESPRKPKKTGKARIRPPEGVRRSQQTADELAAEVVNDAVRAKKPRKRDKRRNVTPEDAEEVEIVTSEVTMSQLTGKLRTGKRSTRDKALQVIQEADKDKKKMARKKVREGTTEEQPADDEEPAETAEAQLGIPPGESRRSPSFERAVPSTIIVNGQIQIDESSLIIDRHARAARARDAEAEEAVDETENTRRINSASWLKVDRSGGWNEVLTDQFYEGLRMFGTDFNMISKMFPGRTRHSVKLKFNKEERLNGWKIEATLKGEKLPVDIDEYSKLSNIKFSDPSELDRDIAEDKQRIEDEEARAKAAMEEAERERAEHAAREAAAEGEESNAEEDEANDENLEQDAAKTEKKRKTARRPTERRQRRGAAGEARSKRRAKAGAVTS